MYFNEVLNYDPNEIRPTKKEPAVDVHLAAATLMFKVIESDGETHRMEVAHMVEILKNQFSLSTDEIGNLFESAHKAVKRESGLEKLTQQLCQNLDTRERYQLLNDFWQIATADHKIRQGERAMIDEIANNLELDPEDITRARYKAEQKLELNIT